jgi:hypothetical protein
VGTAPTLLEADPSHALSDTALVNKVALQAADLLIEEMFCLPDRAA